MRTTTFTIITTILLVILGRADCYSQNKDLVDSYNRINSILSEYEVEVPETQYQGSDFNRGHRWLLVKNLKFSYSYPNVTISYEVRYAPGVTEVANCKPGRRVVSFSLLDSELIFFEDRVNKENSYYSYQPTHKEVKFSSGSGIEKTEFGKKTIIKDWYFYGTSMLMKKLHTELVTFKQLAQGYTGSLGSNNSSNNTSVSKSASTSGSSKKMIQMERGSDNTFRIPCKVNGLSLKFIFDTGASTVTMSLTEANFMIKQGLITQNDIVGSSYYSIADGSITEGTIVILRKIEIGGMVLKDVRASVIHSQNAPLLLGQNVISRLGKIQIDYKNSTLTIIRE